jgi:hypothetical protein
MLACEFTSFRRTWFNNSVRADASARGQALDSLVSSDLGERFYSWSGASSARYVCSIFAVGEEAVVAGFSQGVVIGVHRDGSLVQPVCLIRAQDFTGGADDAFFIEARESGVTEWHVHFAGGEAELRDLASSLLD